RIFRHFRGDGGVDLLGHSHGQALTGRADPRAWPFRLTGSALFTAATRAKVRRMTMTVRSTTLFRLVFATTALAGCGSSDAAPGAPGINGNTPGFSDSAIADLKAKNVDKYVGKASLSDNTTNSDGDK